MDKIFVFGSNRLGIHGAGAAKTARLMHGARLGVGEGRTGNAYAIPTKAHPHAAGLPLESIREGVDRFLSYARANPGLTFQLTTIACGHAGYSTADIAPMFRDAPDNVILPGSFKGRLR